MGKVILIADDDEKNLRLIHDLLQAKGFTPLDAVDGKEAIEMAKTSNPDLVLMDIMMPVMGGEEATRVLKANSSTRNIPIMALTSSAMPEDKDRLMAAGFDDYMTKPIDIHVFLKRVQKLLGK